MATFPHFYVIWLFKASVRYDHRFEYVILSLTFSIFSETNGPVQTPESFRIRYRI
jgi:hypothetical protein